jgi:hypothetical protein
MLRKLLVAFVLLVVVLVVAADRVGARVAAHVLAGKLQTDEHLSSRPSVKIGGLPFLTQAWHGHYGDVRVSTNDFITPDHVQLDTMSVDLLGVHVPLSDVLKGSVKTVPVDRVTGTVSVSFVDLEAYLARHGITLKLSETVDGDIGIRGSATQGSGLPKVLNGVAKISVSNSVLTLSVALGLTGARLVQIPVPLGGLPFRLTVKSVTVSADGITGTGVAKNVVLGS